MASYARFLGREVTVNYRVGDIMLPASGIFVGDSGRSIFLEQHIEQRGRRNYFRWEIPYQYIQRIAETGSPVDEAELASSTETVPQVAEQTSSRPASLAARAASGGSVLLPLSHGPKTA